MNRLTFLIAFRYFNTKIQDRFISLITKFSVTGIALGVATLIVVMSVMKGYEVQFINKLIGLNGHLIISSHDEISTEKLDQIRVHNNVTSINKVILSQKHIFPLSRNYMAKIT